MTMMVIMIIYDDDYYDSDDGHNDHDNIDYNNDGGVVYSDDLK